MRNNKIAIMNEILSHALFYLFEGTPENIPLARPENKLL